MTRTPLWQLSDQLKNKTNLSRFIDEVSSQTEAVHDYDSLYKWSIDQSLCFWEKVWSFCGVKGVLETSSDTALSCIETARFFPSSSVNYAENCLKHAKLSPLQPAIVSYDEKHNREEITFKDLEIAVQKAQLFLKIRGFKKGDRLIAMTANRIEAIVMMLAVTSLGGIWCSASPDFGEQGLADRFEQVDAAFLFITTGYYYNGKTFDCQEKVSRLLSKLPSIKHIIAAEFAAELTLNLDNKTHQVEVTDYQIILQEGPSGFPMIYENTLFSDPMWILFSSGTTGQPKCITHSIGGALLQHLKEHQLHSDIKPNDKLFYFTTCGWMMWNWMVSALASGSTVVLFDGSPFANGPETLWQIVEKENVTHFGTSAKYIEALFNADYKAACDFQSLRQILSTGSPLSEGLFDYIYQAIKSDVHLASISGGTDIVSCFALGNPLKPVYRGELQGPGLGMAVDVYDEMGISQKASGKKGELVCTKPFPAAPLGFWRDKTGEKFHNAYFARYENIWHHGDYVAFTENNGLKFYGRSDAVLNPGGVRIGTAEIYRCLEAIEAVDEGLVVGQEIPGDVRVILFVKLKADETLNDALIQMIRKTIREKASPRHVPAKVLAVSDIPKTRSGKIVELAIRELIHGRPIKNKTAIANPNCLGDFIDRPEIRD